MEIYLELYKSQRNDSLVEKSGVVLKYPLAREHLLYCEFHPWKSIRILTWKESWSGCKIEGGYMQRHCWKLKKSKIWTEGVLNRYWFSLSYILSKAHDLGEKSLGVLPKSESNGHDHTTYQEIFLYGVCVSWLFLGLMYFSSEWLDMFYALVWDSTCDCCIFWFWRES